ncbi:MAG TPA: hypothetical protein VJB59_09905 [Bdellovibrionota bacterium]|nr:hypothetical protein [Bdellovibrionota bacterium]
MKFRFSLLITLSLLTAQQAHALDVLGVPLVLHANLSAMAGSTNVGDDFKSPMLVQWSGSGTAAYKFYSIFMGGLAAGFTQISQYSDSLMTGSGSLYRGTRFFLNPTIGADINENIRIFAELEVLGNWQLYAKNASGQSTSFAHPLGAKIQGLYRLPWMNGRFYGGVQMELLTFGTMNREGTTSRDLTERQKLWGAGLVLGAAF